MRRTGRSWTLAVLASALALACSDDDDDPSPRGRGSAACHAWQDAVCNFAERCGSLTRAQCEASAKGIYCKSDMAANDCAAQLSSVACGVPPSGCDIREMADPEPAIQACHGFVETVCALEARCGGADVQECVAEQEAMLDCQRTIGVALKFESCLSALEGYQCGAAPPTAACMGALLF